MRKSRFYRSADCCDPTRVRTLDFMHDRLFGGRAFRALSMEDEFSRSGLALEMSFSFPSRSVVAVLDSVAAIYGYPKYVRIDNGTELASKLMQQWSEDHDVELLHPAGKADAEWLPRILQQPRSNRTSQCALVSHPS